MELCKMVDCAKKFRRAAGVCGQKEAGNTLRKVETPPLRSGRPVELLRSGPQLKVIFRNAQVNFAVKAQPGLG